MAEARERHIESHRAGQLRAEADAWHDADRLRRYCDAMDARHGEHPPTAEWLAWARGYADRLDPLMQPPSMPVPRTPHPRHCKSTYRTAGARTARRVSIRAGDDHERIRPAYDVLAPVPNGVPVHGRRRPPAAPVKRRAN